MCKRRKRKETTGAASTLQLAPTSPLSVISECLYRGYWSGEQKTIQGRGLVPRIRGRPETDGLNEGKDGEREEFRTFYPPRQKGQRRFFLFLDLRLVPRLNYKVLKKDILGFSGIVCLSCFCVQAPCSLDHSTSVDLRLI